MPEFVHVFQKGKMNKDLDERLIPNGEYRDALNLDLANSDNGNLGVLQNVEGNIQLIGKEGTGNTWSTGFIDQYSNPTCIGTYRNDITEKVYWFIASDAISAIAELDQTTNVISPILVDTQNILKFSKDYLITGINILDNLLFWTDDQTEPKKINIEKFKIGSTDFLTQTKIPFYNQSNESYSTTLTGQPDFTEADVTTIKKSPLTAPTLDVGASKFGSDLAGTGVTPVRTSYAVTDQENFTYVPDVSGAPGEYRSMPTYGEYLKNITNDPTFYNGSSMGAGWNGFVVVPVIAPPTYANIPGTSTPVWAKGDILILTASKKDDFNNSYEYTIRLLVESIAANNVTSSIQSISTDILKFSEPLLWDTVLEEGAPMFEYVFPRLAYRWKYIDNEYSAFSPFSEVAFVGSEFKYVSSDGYNIGMTNKMRRLVVESLTWGSEEVVEIDILFKESSNNLVYVVDTLRRDDYTTSTAGGEVLGTTFEVISELVGAVVEGNQILRPWDNVPRLAKSQEVIANRIVYANYLQNYSLSNSINLELDITRTPHPSNAIDVATGEPLGEDNLFTRLPRKSVKSIRTYQAGVVYKDTYGRETPVFSNKVSSSNIQIDESDALNQLKITPLNDPPSWASHYKFFIKETSNEYYNLAMDRFYSAEDGNIWLSFPSSERNKVDEETYLILKKQHDTNVPVTELNRYKILSIEPEAPAFIAEFEKSIYSGSFDTNNIEPGFLTLNLTGVDFRSDPTFGRNLTSDNKITLSLPGGGTSDEYNIEKGQVSGANFNTYTIYLKEPLGDDVAFLNGRPKIDANLFTEEVKNKPEFEGRFFVKINRDIGFDQNIINPFAALDKKYAVVSQTNIVPINDGYLNNDNAIVSNGPFWMDNGLSLRNGNPEKYRMFGNGGWANARPGGPTDSIGWIFRESDQGLRYAFNYNPPTNGATFFGYSFVAEVLRPGQFLNALTGSVLDDGNIRSWARPNGTAQPGTSIRFLRKQTGEYSQVYEIKDIASNYNYRGKWRNGRSGDNEPDGHNARYTIVIELTKPIFEPWLDVNFNPLALQALNIRIEQVTDVFDGDNKLLTSTNPAIFETEPKENIDLDLYYEASDAFPINTHGQEKTLDWFNCYSYGNGVESNRIRDDYNAVTIGKGVKVSTVLDEPYAQERRGSGFIFSQIYNSTSGINRLNQFIQALPITKDLNPIYGTIQKLHARDTDLITLCEDKCFKVLANKDALYNADGNVNLTGNNAVLGQTMPYGGEYGISKNPESFAQYAFRTYFTDKNRGAVLRLSMDGITVISEQGMDDFISDNLAVATNLIGNYDEDKGLYNLTLNNLTPYWQKELSSDQEYNLEAECGTGVAAGLITETTISYKEGVGGWTSRKSFIPEGGISLNNIYYTFKDGLVWEHSANALYNNFYGIQYFSLFNTVINEIPNSVKAYKTLNYSGTASREIEYSNNSKWYSLAEITANQLLPDATRIKKEGWYTNFIRTNLESGEVKEFLDKEGKYFNYIKTLNVCGKQANGIGSPTVIVADPQDYFVTVTIDSTCSPQ